jgi:hypothetical protein
MVCGDEGRRGVGVGGPAAGQFAGGPAVDEDGLLVGVDGEQAGAFQGLHEVGQVDGDGAWGAGRCQVFGQVRRQGSGGGCG